METNATSHVRRCRLCQVHENAIHAPVVELHSRRLSRAYDKMMHRRSFEPGDQVLRAAEHVMRSAPPLHKFSEKWEGPYIVNEVHDIGYCTLLNRRNNNAHMETPPAARPAAYARGDFPAERTKGDSREDSTCCDTP
ncbi:hypothetical protein COLO4_37676 [Corchorus olitorius]|uniref:Uncharacterized protein n=1 Tax=Corchorus olitorius TaxID=93759 RepID=A0A1R3G019_9ROSI|nr:hypothetical protein COLO4_37676 [Corchorus olitorius]